MGNDKKTGRPESLNAEYFSHSVHESDVLKVMYRKYKYEGYTAYFRLLEQISKADLMRVELKNETQRLIFQMNMDVEQDVIDFLIDLLLQMGEMNTQQWENNQTIYLDKFVKQFKYLWYKRGKTIPGAKGNFDAPLPQKKDTNRVSDVGKGNNRIEYNSNNKIEEDGQALSFSEYEKLYPDKNLKSLKNYLNNDNPSHKGAKNWCERELKKKPKTFTKTASGNYYKAWCSKCGKESFPKDNWQLKQGSECCRVEYINEKPKKC